MKHIMKNGLKIISIFMCWRIMFCCADIVEKNNIIKNDFIRCCIYTLLILLCSDLLIIICSFNKKTVIAEIKILLITLVINILWMLPALIFMRNVRIDENGFYIILILALLCQFLAYRKIEKVSN